MLKLVWTRLKRTIPHPIKHLLRLYKDDISALMVFITDYKEWKHYRDQKKIIYVLTPEHGNIGDAAIAYGTDYFLRKEFPNMLVLEFPVRMVRTHKYILKKIINQEDLIILHGGGNLGDWYPAEELLRQRMVKDYRNNKIISLPQTISFSKRKYSDWMLKKAIKVYTSHPQFTLICRDEKSFQFSQENFKGCLLCRMPDMALCLEDHYFDKSQIRENSLLFCLRNDIEKACSMEFIEQIKQQCTPLFNNIYYTDTWIDSLIYSEQRKSIVEEKIGLFRKQSLVITDRYHGVIFAYLTGTPCIAIGSADHKVEENSKYFKDANLIKFVRDIDDFKQAVKELNEVREHKRLCFTQEHFNSLKQMMSQSITKIS